MIGVTQFAQQHRLRLKRDGCGDRMVPGRLGHIGEHCNGLFSIVLEDTTSGRSRARTPLKRRRTALAAGFRLHQAGDCESVLLFDPTDLQQVRCAIRLVKAKRKRLASPAQLANLRKPYGGAVFQRPGTAHLAYRYTKATEDENKRLPSTEAFNSESERAQ